MKDGIAITAKSATSMATIDNSTSVKPLQQLQRGPALDTNLLCIPNFPDCPNTTNLAPTPGRHNRPFGLVTRERDHTQELRVTAKKQAGNAMKRYEESALARRFGWRSGAAGVFYDVGELRDIFELPVDRSKSHVGDGIELTQLAHHEFTEAVALDLALAAAKQLVLDAGDRRVDRIGCHRALSQRQLHARGDLAAVEFGAAAVLLDDRRQCQLNPLVRRKTFVAGRTAAAPPNRGAVLGYARIHHLRIVMPAEGAAHRRSAVDRETLRQLGDLRAHAFDRGGVFRVVEHVGDQVAHL